MGMKEAAIFRDLHIKILPTWAVKRKAGRTGSFAEFQIESAIQGVKNLLYNCI